MKKLITAFTSLALLASCAPPPSQNNYNENEVGRSAIVSFGTVITERQVNITGNSSGVGAVGGAGAGALAGSAIGHGNGSLVGLLAGAVIGGVAGAAAEQAMKDRKGIEYTITDEHGLTRTVTQNIAKDDKPIEIGHRVMVQDYGTYQRVLPADDLPTKIKRPKKIKVEDDNDN